MSRLTVLHINIIGAVVAIIVGVALYFTIITAAQDQVKKNQEEYNSVKAEADKLPGARRSLAQAEAEKKKTEADYAVYRVKYIPTLNYTGTTPQDRVKTMMRVWWPNNGKSWPERFIAGVRGHMRAEARRNRITWLNPTVLVLPPYGPDPNRIDMGDGDKAISFPAAGAYPISVRGPSYQSLMNHLASWNQVRGVGVPTIDGVSLQGNSPNLVMNYNLRFTVIVEEDVPPSIGKISGNAGAGGGGGPAGGFGSGAGMAQMMRMGGGGPTGPGASAGMAQMMGGRGVARPGGAAPASGGGGAAPAGPLSAQME